MSLAAQLSGVSRNTRRAAAQPGQFPARRICPGPRGQWVLTLAAIDAWLKAARHRPGPLPQRRPLTPTPTPAESAASPRLLMARLAGAGGSAAGGPGAAERPAHCALLEGGQAAEPGGPLPPGARGRSPPPSREWPWGMARKGRTRYRPFRCGVGSTHPCAGRERLARAGGPGTQCPRLQCSGQTTPRRTAPARKPGHARASAERSEGRLAGHSGRGTRRDARRRDPRGPPTPPLPPGTGGRERSQQATSGGAASGSAGSRQRRGRAQPVAGACARRSRGPAEGRGRAL